MVVRIGEVISLIDAHSQRGIAPLGVGYTVYESEELNLVRSHLEELDRGGEEFISDPWPVPDRTRPSNTVSWRLHEEYTEDRLLERTQAVYAAALRIYVDMVSRWFQAFENRLRLMCLLPVSLEGYLMIPQSSGQANIRAGMVDEPSLTWWPHPIDRHEDSQVTFELDPQTPASREEAVRRRDAAQSDAYARTDDFFYSMTRLHVFVPRAATELAHKWLIGELGRIGWTDLLG